MIHTYSGEWIRRPLKMPQASSMAAFLVCPGPSLAGIDPKAFQRPGIFTAAITSAYPAIRPDIWIGGDTPDCYHPNLMMESFPKYFQGGLAETKFKDLHSLKYAFNTHFIDTNQCPFMEHPENHVVSFPRSTFLMALEFLIKAGFQRIYLVGCDLGGSRDYWHDDALSEEFRKVNAGVHQYIRHEICRTLPKIEKHCHLYSCSPESPLNAAAAKFVPIYQALDREAKDESKGFKFRHVLDIKGKRDVNGEFPVAGFTEE